jgi:mRNA-degrading endonuclease toxin of MazEF toxin-antitoxin module
MSKDFDGWNKQKKKVHERDEDVRFHEREIWWCSLGINVGSEQDGVSKSFQRPVLIIKNFNGQVLWVLPLTRTYKMANRYYFFLEEGEKGNSVVVLSQLRLISSKRLIRKIRTLEEWQFKNIVRAIKALLPDSS